LKKQSNPTAREKNRLLSAVRKKKRKARIKSAIYSADCTHEENLKISLEGKAMVQSEKLAAKIKKAARYRQYVLGGPERQAEKKKEHRLELYEQYDKIIEEFRLKNRLPKGTDILYDPKKKQFTIKKAMVKGRPEDPVETMKKAKMIKMPDPGVLK